MRLITLSDEQLINAYIKAKRKKLDKSYIKLLYEEIILRGLLFETIVRS